MGHFVEQRRVVRNPVSIDAERFSLDIEVEHVDIGITGLRLAFNVQVPIVQTHAREGA